MKEEVLETKADGNGTVTKAQKGLEFRRYFTREGISPYDTVEWEYRTASITNLNTTKSCAIYVGAQTPAAPATTTDPEGAPVCR